MDTGRTGQLWYAVHYVASTEERVILSFDSAEKRLRYIRENVPRAVEVTESALTEQERMRALIYQG